MSGQKIITLLTDFGSRDVYVGVMKGVIAAIAPQATVIDLTHEIPPQDLVSGSFALQSACSYFPQGTVHVAVVDPGVGSQRRGVAVLFAGGYLVGADNGLFSGVLHRQQAIAAVELNNPDYWRTPHPSQTFHGRDIFAAVGAHLANGVKLNQLGEAISLESLVTLPLLALEKDRQQITGVIQYCDRFGNLVTNIPGHDVFSQAQVKFQERLIRLVTTYSSSESQALVALVGSHGFLEIAVNCGSAREVLQAKIGDRVVVINEEN